MAYPDRLRHRVRVLYEVEGLGPLDIQARLAQGDEDNEPAKVPKDTIKSWVRGLVRGAAAPPPTRRAAWNFDAAEPEDCVIVSEIFDRMVNQEQEPHPMSAWPSQDVADWYVKLRRIDNHAPFKSVHDTARYLAMLDRRIGTPHEHEDDDFNRDLQIAEFLEHAAFRRRTAAQEFKEF